MRVKSNISQQCFAHPGHNAALAGHVTSIFIVGLPFSSSFLVFYSSKLVLKLGKEFSQLKKYNIKSNGGSCPQSTLYKSVSTHSTISTHPMLFISSIPIYILQKRFLLDPVPILTSLVSLK
jgi:hypothetical protein